MSVDNKTASATNAGEQSIEWPKKLNEMHNHHMDSEMWKDFQFRDDDIVISTYGKSGTTWMQQIVAQLIFNGELTHNGQGVAELSPWVDLRVPPKEVKIGALEAQTQRRFMKTHLPVNALEFSPKAKYIYVARDGRDVVMSLHNHHASALPMWYGALNDTPGRVGPPIAPPSADRAAYFQEWLDKDGFPFWPFWENVRTWWAVRNLPNVLLVHFADLKADLPGMIRKIAAFLEVTIDEAKFPVIVEHCTFAWMKKNATASVPMGGAFWEGGAETFIYKGENARWTSVLSAEQSAQYKDRAVAELGEECAAWLNK